MITSAFSHSPRVEELERRLTPGTFRFASRFVQAVESAREAVVTVVREGERDRAETVLYEAGGGAGTAPLGRYTPRSGTLTFNAGVASQTFAVPLTNDGILNYNQTVALRLREPGGGGALGSPADALLTVVDDEAYWDDAALRAANPLPAHEGVGALQYAPDGTLTQLVWHKQGAGYDLLYLRRNEYGDWSRELVTRFTDPAQFSAPGYQPQQVIADGVLVFDSSGVPHVIAYDLNARGVLRHYRPGQAGWQQVESISFPPTEAPPGFIPPELAGPKLHALAAAAGPGGALHVAFTRDSGLANSVLFYGSNKTGAWALERVNVATLGNAFGNTLTPRVFSLAVDSLGAAHIAYQVGSLDGSSVGFLSNRSGTWQAGIVFTPPDPPGDAGVGGISLAIGPGDTVAVANTYTDRVPSLSPLFSHLLYHTLTPSGVVTEVVATTPDGYVSDDGPRFTGNAPQLRFDPQGRPHIAFSDIAGSHVNGAVGVDGVPGQLRHAVKEGGVWHLETVVRQTDPTRERFYFGGLALHPGSGVAFGGVRSTTVSTFGVNASNSTYEAVIADGVARSVQRFQAVASAFTRSYENYQGIVTAAYQNYLKRVPDLAGLAHWVTQMQRGLTNEQLESLFLAAPEYVNANGGPDPNGRPGPEWVRGMYRDLLGREADPAGLAFWSAQLAAGASPFTIAFGFAASREREEARVADNYVRYLDRAPDAAGLDFWVTAFTRGVTNEQLAAGFLASREYFFNHGGGTLGSWVRSLYREVLRREPGLEEVNGWLRVLLG